MGDAAVVICASCGQENPAGFRFCGRRAARMRQDFGATVTLLGRAGGRRRAVEWLLAFLRIRNEPEGAAEAALREAEAAIAAREVDGDHEVLPRAWNLIAEAHLVRAQAVEQTRALECALHYAREAGDLTLEVELVTHSAQPIIFGAPAPAATAGVSSIPPTTLIDRALSGWYHSAYELYVGAPARHGHLPVHGHRGFYPPAEATA